MAHRPELLEIGRVTRAHGLRGEVVVLLTTDRWAERTQVGTELRTPEGRSLIVGAARAHQDRWIVTFEGVTTREDAESLQGRRLFAAPLDDPDTVFAHDVIGRRLVDQHGTEHGTITALEANPASDLLVVDGQRLVPTVFFFSFDDDVVRVDVPAGLLD
jgi:16S rRNA processing protein RimM